MSRRVSLCPFSRGRPVSTVNLTPSAVSRRIQTLERELGTPLFTRFTRRLELTAAGARFLDATGRGIYLIEEATAAVRPRRHGRVVRLSTAQYLASTWLLPQLVVLRRRRPDIDIRIETSAELVDLIEGEYDAEIRSGEGRWPGLGKQQFIASLLKAFSESLPCVVALGFVPAQGPKLGIAQARLRRERPHETADNLIRITFEAIVGAVADAAELAMLRPR